MQTDKNRRSSIICIIMSIIKLIKDCLNNILLIFNVKSQNVDFFYTSNKAFIHPINRGKKTFSHALDLTKKGSLKRV